MLYASFNHTWRYEFERIRNHAMIATFLYTGLRAEELLTLELIDVDLESGVLLVRAGKGGKDRYVPLHPKLRYILRRYLQERSRLGRNTLRLFVSATRDRGLSYKALTRVCRVLSQATGVKFTPHALRHTFGSVAVEQQMGLAQLKEILGHQDISSTMIYVKMSPGALKDSMSRVELF